MICSIQEVYDAIGAVPSKTVAVAQAADEHVLQAAEGARREGYVRPVLIGDAGRIRALAGKLGIDPASCEVVDRPDDREAAECAVRMVHNGQADVVMKGLMDSSVFLKAVLNREYGLREEGKAISAIAVMELKALRRLVFMTDLGITPLPDLAAKAKLIESTAAVARRFGIETPKVAVLSAAEKLNEKMASSREAYALAEMNRRGELPGCQVAGPISFDLALSAAAAEEKGYTDPVAGKADILLVPSIEVGNAVYKALMLFADMETGGIIAGTRAPVVFCSRADSALTKKNTLALAVYLAGTKDVRP